MHWQKHKHRLAGVQSPEELPCSARTTRGCSALPTPHPPGTHAAGSLQRGWSGAVCSGLHLSTLVSIVSDNIRKGSHHYLQTFFFFFCFGKLISNQSLLPKVCATDFKALRHRRLCKVCRVQNLSHLYSKSFPFAFRLPYTVSKEVHFPYCNTLSATLKPAVSGKMP